MFRSLIAALLVSVCTVQAFAPHVHPRTTTTSKTSSSVVVLSASVDRRTMLTNVVALGTWAGFMLDHPRSALAKTAFVKLNEPADNEIVKEQNQVVDKLDVNNAPVADYMKLPGMYPTIAGKIANNGPYKTVADVYKVQGLASEEKSTISKYEKFLTATEPKGMDVMRGRDPYRRSFNDSTEVNAPPKFD